MYRVLNGFNGDKAPGLNGFSMAFFQSCWSVLKKVIVEVFQNFHTQVVFEKSLNTSFLALKRQMVWRSRIFGLTV